MNFSQNVTPGPGTYNLQKKPEAIKFWSPITIKCFFEGSDVCCICETPLYADYYQGPRSLYWCLLCFRNALSSKPENFLLAKAKKFRHCIAYHGHIGLENIIRHKVSSRNVRRLRITEKAMWCKYGNMLDFNGLPT